MCSKSEETWKHGPIDTEFHKTNRTESPMQGILQQTERITLEAP